MNNLSKIFLVIIIVLSIALIVVISLYLKQRNLIYEYFGNYNFSIENENNEVPNTNIKQ